ncbi:hypothetical protein [Legionella parisiensis]|uniref:Uncharacterized protein n=1 Tax=Legionella parisiensis TaxID=45071 RepID=A0A1E5JVN2_9GAMM|nr:hypothetical protein [Legionella parisiensis]KTD40167.1 hypothetical protein Lpar_1484 [Legionella parisiensis]OEH48587.1 hypothetical protein lpari_00345 [Legionella parisiensis]STX77287.1 Uncharacterised protein [Legionella parisiensis]
MRKELQVMTIVSIILYGVTSFAYSIRNTYPEELVCVQVKKPHTTYNIPANVSSDNFDNAPFLAIKVSGNYKCKTGDGVYTSICSVSDIQEAATFNTHDGSASCSTPVKIR